MTLGAKAQEPTRLSEVYGDWTVNCATSEDGATRTCFMTQTLAASENNQRVLQAEMGIVDGATQFVLLTPLGVLLPAGVIATIDEQESETLSFHTCLSAGCIVRSTLTAEQLAAIRAGDQMMLEFKAADTEAALKLRLSLAGVSAAYNRLSALAR